MNLRGTSTLGHGLVHAARIPDDIGATEARFQTATPCSSTHEAYRAELQGVLMKDVLVLGGMSDAHLADIRFYQVVSSILIYDTIELDQRIEVTAV